MEEHSIGLFDMTSGAQPELISQIDRVPDSLMSFSNPYLYLKNGNELTRIDFSDWKNPTQPVTIPETSSRETSNMISVDLISFGQENIQLFTQNGRTYFTEIESVPSNTNRGKHLHVAPYHIWISSEKITLTQLNQDNQHEVIKSFKLKSVNPRTLAEQDLAFNWIGESERTQYFSDSEGLVAINFSKPLNPIIASVLKKPVQTKENELSLHFWQKNVGISFNRDFDAIKLYRLSDYPQSPDHTLQIQAVL